MLPRESAPAANVKDVISMRIAENVCTFLVALSRVIALLGFGFIIGAFEMI
jgi:hypothetical protein